MAWGGFATPAPVESGADPPFPGPCTGDDAGTSNTSATFTVTDPGFATTTTTAAPTTTTTAAPAQAAPAATPVASSPTLTG